METLVRNHRKTRCLLLMLLATLSVAGVAYAFAEHRGEVRFGQVPVPGSVIRATQGDKTVLAVTGPDGTYCFSDIGSGAWTVQVEATGFETSQREVVVSSDSVTAQWDLKMLPLDNLKEAGTSSG